MKPINPPHTGHWNIHGYPDEITVDIGPWRRRFKKTSWKQAYPHVVEQYREDVPRDSMHLFVRDDGTFVIDHTDADNPDHGRVVEHVLNDTPIGPVVAGVAAVGGAILVVGAIASLVKNA